jgi:hypothetical protein
MSKSHSALSVSEAETSSRIVWGLPGTELEHCPNHCGELGWRMCVSCQTTLKRLTGNSYNNPFTGKDTGEAIETRRVTHLMSASNEAELEFLISNTALDLLRQAVCWERLLKCWGPQGTAGVKMPLHDLPWHLFTLQVYWSIYLLIDWFRGLNAGPCAGQACTLPLSYNCKPKSFYWVTTRIPTLRIGSQASDPRLFSNYVQTVHSLPLWVRHPRFYQPQKEHIRKGRYCICIEHDQALLLSLFLKQNSIITLCIALISCQVLEEI